jgi:hypothetical protein
MHKSATKCNETIGKWCKNKHGASKIIDTLETYHASEKKWGRSLQIWRRRPQRRPRAIALTHRLCAVPTAAGASPHPRTSLAAEPMSHRRRRPPPPRSQALRGRSSEIPVATVLGELAGLPRSRLWWRRGEGGGGKGPAAELGFVRHPIYGLLQRDHIWTTYNLCQI